MWSLVCPFVGADSLILAAKDDGMTNSHLSTSGRQLLKQKPIMNNFLMHDQR